MLTNAESLAHLLGPFAAFAVAMIDRSGLPMIVGAVCVAVGAAGGHLVPTVALGTLGMIAGDLVLFELGRRSGAAASFTRRWLRPLKPLRATARAILRRYPTASLAFGRYVAGAGILLPIFAGSAGMKRSRAWTILIAGSVLYIVPWGTAAFLLGQAFVDTMDALGPKLLWLALAGLAAAAGGFAYMRVRRRARKAAMHPHPHGHPHPPD